ncbi:hypothetical protein GGI42DRAFT_311707 [Trichoderma sp. SZMC 28013]
MFPVYLQAFAFFFVPSSLLSFSRLTVQRFRDFKCLSVLILLQHADSGSLAVLGISVVHAHIPINTYTNLTSISNSAHVDSSTHHHIAQRK